MNSYPRPRGPTPTVPAGVPEYVALYVADELAKLGGSTELASDAFIVPFPVVSNFQLSNLPSGSVTLFVNGLEQRPEDFQVWGLLITYNNLDYVLSPDDVVQATYLR